MVFVVFTLALAVFLISVKLTYDALNRKARPPYPPGPKPNVLIGNALDFPKSDAGRIFTEWGKRYNSDILHASAFGQHMVVINSRKIAEDLLEKRARIYNDRPEIPIVDILGWGDNVALLKYGDFWRQHRKLCHQKFHREAAKRYHPIQIDRVHHFLRSLSQQPEKVFEHNRLLSISVTMLMMYGYAPKTLEYPVIHAADESTRLGASLLVPGGTLLNVLPVLRHIPSWVPGASGKKTAERVKLLTEEVKRTPMEHVKAALEGTASPSFVTDFLEKKATVGFLPGEETAIHNIAWTVYGGKPTSHSIKSISTKANYLNAAASDTTIAATDIFLFLMIKYPDVQRKAQAEIDRVIGNNRLPDHNDRPDLPYVEALYREVLRYDQPLRIGVPHALMEDDIYEGYFLPKGAIVTSNIWAMTHDEDIYPDPFAFKPERHFDGNGRLIDENRVLAYGFGTRICVGKSLATDLMWLLITSFLACFNIDKANDKDGNEIEVDETFFEIGVLTRKKPFANSIRPRSEAIQNLIHSSLT